MQKRLFWLRDREKEWAVQCQSNSWNWMENHCYTILWIALKSLSWYQRLYWFTKVKYVVPGGKERYDSVYEGLKACEACDIVYIHDGARPFPDAEMLKQCMEAAVEYGACVAAVPSKDTIKIGTEEGIVKETPDRKTLWNVQTHQVFQYDLISKAHREIRKGSMEGVTDDSMIVESLHLCPVKLVMGSYDNIKVTTPEDLVVAENILQRRIGTKEQQ